MIPDLHDEEPQADGGGLERYRAICSGRSETIEATLGRGSRQRLPASSAAGSRGGPLLVAFLAGARAAEHLENPRQVAAWAYPPCHGRRPPSFARATRSVHPGAELLLAGTAGIVGHASRHPGDLEAQTLETLANLDVLLAHRRPGASLRPGTPCAFVGAGAEAARVVALVRARYGAGCALFLVEADLCRRELLVEIEGVADGIESETTAAERPMASGAPTSPAPASDATHDAIVIGGGFAGASLALLLRRMHPGARVLVVERQRAFDRKVGEATVEVSAFFLAHVLRLGERLLRDHLPKHGLTYWFSRDGDERLEEMTEVGGAAVPALPSYQLDRSRLDESLLELALAEGAEVWRPARVLEADPDFPSGRVLVEYAGRRHELRARWILDASGRRRWLGQRLGLQRPIDALPTHALWGRWRGVRDLDGSEVLGTDPGRPLLCSTPRQRRLCTNHFMDRGAWTWMIPLANGETSVGLVLDPRHHHPPDASSGRVRAKERYLAYVRSRPGLRELLRDAELVEGDFRSYQHLPYTTSRYMGSGFALVGDAGSFLDPYYSPGLDHACSSIFATARLVQRDLAGELAGAGLQAAIRRHDERFRRSIERWFDALYRDKYELFGDAELTAAAFFLDTALYYVGVVAPLLRDVDALAIPPFGADHPLASLARHFMSLYRRRLVRLARRRRARGTFGARNRGWRCLCGSFGGGTRMLPAPFWRGLGLWLGGELRELRPLPRRAAKEEREARPDAAARKAGARSAPLP